MRVAHLTAVSHSLSMNEPSSRNSVLFENVGGTYNFLGGLPSGHLSNCTATSSGGCFSRRSGNFSLSPSLAALNKSSFTMRSTLTHHRYPGIACQQNYIIFVSDRIFSLKDMGRRSHMSVSSSERALNFRVVFQQVGNHLSYTHTVLRHLRRLKVSSVSSKNGTAADEVSNDGKEQDSPTNSLKFIHKVTLDVLAPPDLVWKLWTDIKSAPLWMRWIDRVDFLDDDGIIDSCQDLPPGLRRLSRWICSTIGFEVMWVARVENVESNPPVRVLRWATVEGLSSRGEVTFKENDTRGTTVELSISHSLPAALGRVMQSGALRSLVQATLQNDLECFQKYAAEVVNQQPECNSSGEECVLEKRGSLKITTACSQNMSDPR